MGDYYKTRSILVKQPIGEFFVAVIPAKILKMVTYTSLVTKKELLEDGFLNNDLPYGLDGVQRVKDKRRLKDIGKYIDTVEMAFPNTIILGANFDKKGNLIQETSRRWRIEGSKEDGYFLIIPGDEKLANVIDGQHRLWGFDYATKIGRPDVDLVCSVFLDLPNPYQAYLFATINSNQKKVDRSLTYELFGYNLESKPMAWTPEQFSVYISRRLNKDDKSPFHNHILLAPQDDNILLQGYKRDESSWRVSTATTVDGILSLITSNSRRDKNTMLFMDIDKGRSRKLLADKPGAAPLRNEYIQGNDKLIYVTVINYFMSVQNLLWSHSADNSYINKTVGIQALFDYLKYILRNNFENDRDISVNYFNKFIHPSTGIDFSDDFFQASGKGRTRIKTLLKLKAELITIDDVPQGDIVKYRKFIERLNK